MESYHRSKPNDSRWLPILCAAAGTLLLAFVPSGAWLARAQTPEAQLLARAFKALLTVLLLTVVPALWARLAHTVSPWMLAALGVLAFGGGMLVSGDAKSALYTLLLIALPGAGLYLLQRLRLSNFRTVIYGSFLILAALFGYLCLPGLIEKGDGYGWFRDAIGLFRQTLEPLGMTDVEVAGVKVSEIIETYRDNAEAATVPVMLSAAMAASLSNTLLSHLWNRHGGAALTALPRFEDWRCERWYVILTAVLAIGTMLLSLFGWSTANGLASVAEELWRLPCMLAGLCTVRRIGVRIRRGWIMWIAIGALLMLPTVTGMVLSVLGMLSSLRKPLNTGENGGQL